MAFQPVYRRGKRSNAQARHLVHDTHVARYLLPRLIFCVSRELVIPMSAQEDFTKGDVTITQGECYFLVQSCAPGYYYVAVRRGQDWQCSCQEEVRQKCIGMVEQFLSEPVHQEVA